MRNLFKWVFLLTAFLHLLGTYLQHPILEFVTKPLLIPSLGFWLIDRSNLYFGLLGALFFSWVGDSLLLFQANQLFFMLGLGAFLIAHLFYIQSFFHLRNPGPIDFKSIILMTAIIGVYLYMLLVKITPGLNDMIVPVYIYAAVISIMLLASIFRKNKTSPKSYYYVVFGALCFVLSDSLIAWNKFANPLIQSGLFIMTTYLAAQYFIVKGLIIHSFKSS